MAETTIQTIAYAELTDELKDRVREQFKNSEELVPHDWYEYEFEYITEKYGKQIDIDDRSISIDPYHNDYSWVGTIDFHNVGNKKFIPKKFYEYMKKEWIYDVTESFKDDEMIRKDDFTIDTNIIAVDVEKAFFGDLTKNSFRDGLAEISIDEYKPMFEKAVAEYGYHSNYAEEKIKEWLGMMDVADTIFFQSTINIDLEDYTSIPDEIVYSLEEEIQKFMDGPFYDSLDEFVSNIYEELRTKLRKSYEYHFEDEYADAHLEEMVFDVDVDEDGNQIDVADLNGRYD